MPEVGGSNLGSCLYLRINSLIGFLRDYYNVPTKKDIVMYCMQNDGLYIHAIVL